jgi:hypothetical protein
MVLQSFKFWELIVLLLMEVHRNRGVNAALTVTPVDTNATLGSHVRLNCSTDAKTEVNWQYGEPIATDVYIAKEGLVRIYRRKHRYKVEVNSAIGQYDLVISNVTDEDAGVYTCSEPEGWSTPSPARLTLTGGELPAKICRENVVATKGGELQMSFSSCSPQPYYLSHIPVGLSHSNDVYNLGKLLNSYANSGRFTVDIASEGLKLKVTSILLSDAGTYTCRGDSGRGDRHNKELVVLDEMPNCKDNISDANCTVTPNVVTEVSCAVNYTGNCAPHSIWRYEYGDRSNSTVQQEFTCFTETYSQVESRTIIRMKLGSWLTCNIEDTSRDSVQKFQCNTSVVPQQCQNHPQESASKNSTSNSSKTTVIVISVVLAGAIVAGIVVVLYVRHIRPGMKHGRDAAENVALPTKQSEQSSPLMGSSDGETMMFSKHR